MKLVIFGFAIVAAAPASTTNDSEFTTMIRVGSWVDRFDIFNFLLRWKQCLFLASSLGDSRKQKYYRFGYGKPTYIHYNPTATIQYGSMNHNQGLGGPSQGLRGKCYECEAKHSVDKKEPCFKYPERMKQMPCTTDKGCYIKRREETDEYGDVTWLDLLSLRPGWKIFRYSIERGCVNSIVAGTGCYKGYEIGVSNYLILFLSILWVFKFYLLI